VTNCSFIHKFSASLSIIKKNNDALLCKDKECIAGGACRLGPWRHQGRTPRASPPAGRTLTCPVWTPWTLTAAWLPCKLPDNQVSISLYLTGASDIQHAIL